MAVLRIVNVSVRAGPLYETCQNPAGSWAYCNVWQLVEHIAGWMMATGRLDSSGLTYDNPHAVYPNHAPSGLESVACCANG